MAAQDTSDPCAPARFFTTGKAALEEVLREGNSADSRFCILSGRPIFLYLLITRRERCYGFGGEGKKKEGEVVALRFFFQLLEKRAMAPLVVTPNRNKPGETQKTEEGEASFR